MKKKICIVSEADEIVASGHLKECIVLTEELLKRKHDVSLWINDDIPQTFLENVKLTYNTYSRPIEDGIKHIIEYVIKEKVTLLIFNLRQIDNDLIIEVKKKSSVQILCIDEFGHRCLDSDIIVNPMIDISYGKYEGSCQQIYIGNQYLILPTKYYKWNQKEKMIKDKIETVTISMGDVDIHNNTQRLVMWLQEHISSEIRAQIVLGGGYPYLEELKAKIKHNNIEIYHNIDFLDRLFFEADLAFCAGGNTLHELACIGTPTIVIPTMPHEYKNGKKFEEMGFGKTYRNFSEFELFVKDNFYQIFNQNIRQNQSSEGKKCSDGEGYLRVITIIEQNLI